MKLRSLRRQQRRESKRWWQDRLALLGVGATFLAVLLVFFLLVPDDFQQIVFSQSRYVVAYVVTAGLAGMLLFDYRDLFRTVWFWRDFSVWLGLQLAAIEAYAHFFRNLHGFYALLFVAAGYVLVTFVVELHRLGGSLFSLFKGGSSKQTPTLSALELEDIKKWRASGPPPS